MIRSVAAVAAGYGVMVVLVMVGLFALVSVLVPGGMAAARSNPAMVVPTPRYLAANLTLSFVAALVGGLITVHIAAGAPSGHLVGLAALVLVMGVVSARAPGSERQPGWYRITIPLVGVMGVAASALFA